MDRDRGIEFDESGDWFYRLFLTGVVAAGTAILIHVLRLLTETVRTARREQLIGGTAEMLATILIVVGGVIATTVLLRGMVLLLTTFVSGRMKLRRYRSKRRKAYRSINRKQALVEERIRLAARLRATWLFESESHRLANAQARRAFRESLQTSVTRSCEIAFEQIAQVIDQYERVVEEIGESELEIDDKTELLGKLNSQLNIAATVQKSRSAERLMESEIWNLRLQTAERLLKQRPEAALRYLRGVEAATDPCPGRRRIQALLCRMERLSKADVAG